MRNSTGTSAKAPRNHSLIVNANMGRYLIIISSGTADATKVHAGVVNGFAMVKGDPSNKVDFVLMAEGGWVVDDKVMRGIGACA